MPKVSARTRQHHVLHIMPANRWFSVHTIARAMGMTVDTTRLHLQRLHREGRILRRVEEWDEFGTRLALMPRNAPKRGCRRRLLYARVASTP